MAARGKKVMYTPEVLDAAFGIGMRIGAEEDCAEVKGRIVKESGREALDMPLWENFMDTGSHC